MLHRVLEPEAMDTPEDARDYDAMDHSAVNARFVADFLAAHGRCQGGEILDVGTGTARIAIALCQSDPTARVLGIDLAEAMLERARRKRGRRRPDQAAVACLQGDAKALAWPDGRFEAVMSNTIVHHIPDPARPWRRWPARSRPAAPCSSATWPGHPPSREVATLVAFYAGGEAPAARALFEHHFTPR